ncbi:zinc-ribbon domain-containing protein [Pseudobutyrivibrio xylanivorans]|uniref:zinc-ribbon domain-containing protein n=1 Tax=Pseudobutyrivibrio xylanivorans TaxID=185007 RepID=UPI002FE61F84
MAARSGQRVICRKCCSAYVTRQDRRLIWRWRMQSCWPRISTKATGYSLIRIMRFLRKSRGFFKRCSNCGYETAEDFDYCPKCGVRF